MYLFSFIPFKHLKSVSITFEGALLAHSENIQYTKEHYAFDVTMSVSVCHFSCL
jgi:hypothetical protein